MDQIRYVLGLEIGMESVGWAVLRNDENGEPCKMERLGVRTFDRAENPDGSSPASTRREARGERRTARRRRHRRDRVRLLLEQKGIMTREEISELYAEGGFEKSVYELRTDALDRVLTEEEAVRILIHYAKHRGYQPMNGSSEAEEPDQNRILTAVSENRRRMVAGHYRTVGEMLWKDPGFREVRPDGSTVLRVRNGPGEYGMTVSRDMISEEIRTVFKRQRELGAAWASEELEREYLEIWGSQRNYDEGPGGDSPYGGDRRMEKMFGKCPFEKEEPRAPMASCTAEYFQTLQTVNSIRICRSGGSPRFLSWGQRREVARLALSSPNLDYGKIRKKLELPEEVRFCDVSYDGSSVRSSESKTKLQLMPFYHEMKRALNAFRKDYIDELSTEQKDLIAEILTVYQSGSVRRQYLSRLGLPEGAVEQLSGLSAKGAAPLSIKAMQELRPFLEMGMTYQDACVEVYGSTDGISHDAVRSAKLSFRDAEGISNPAAVRAVSQAVKVINAVVREYGPPEAVRIEVEEGLGKSRKERGRVEARQKGHAGRDEEIRGEIRKYKKSSDPTGLDIVKYRLWEEQGGVCLYSGESLDLCRLFEPGYADVDHIIPWSRCFDDSYSNKVLVLSSENRRKGNRIPYEYFGSDAGRWSRFEALVVSRIQDARKRQKLLSKDGSDGRMRDLRAWNLEDGRSLSLAVHDLVSSRLQFADTGRYPRPVLSVRETFASQIRGQLGLEEICAGGDLRHARNAAAAACVSPCMVKKITEYAERRELEYAQDAEDGCLREAGELPAGAEREEPCEPPFPEPWDRFRDELEAGLSGQPREGEETVPAVFVSRAPRHGVSGAGHKEIIRSGKKPGYTVTRTELKKLKLDRKTGEIAGYYNRESDPLLYSALKERLAAFHGDAEKAFEEPLYKPKADGSPGSRVRKVKIEERITLGVDTGRGLAGCGRMVRLDVFHVRGDGYYYVPIYAADTVKRDLPDRAVLHGQPYENWKVMRGEDFLFSLYPDDVVYIRKKNGIRLHLERKADSGSDAAEELILTEGYFYYEWFNIGTGALRISTPDRSYAQNGLGGKRLDLLEKYTVDVLGSLHRVSLPEKRMAFRGDQSGC